MEEDEGQSQGRAVVEQKSRALHSVPEPGIYPSCSRIRPSEHMSGPEDTTHM